MIWEAQDIEYLTMEDIDRVVHGYDGGFDASTVNLFRTILMAEDYYQELLRQESDAQLGEAIEAARVEKQIQDEQNSAAQIQHNADLIRKYMVDPYSECIVRPNGQKTREEIMSKINETVGGALEFERVVRDKEKDLRERMAEKNAIWKLSNNGEHRQAGPDLDHLRAFATIIADSTDYFKGPLTSKVNLRSVLVAHKNCSKLSRDELN